VFAATNPSYTTTELNHHIATCDTQFIITEPEMLPTVVNSAKQCHIPLSHIWIFNHHTSQAIPKGFQSWKELLRYGKSDWVRFDDEKFAKGTPAALFHSSGTTGLPKSAVVSHRNLIAQHTLVYELVEKPYEARRLIALPLFHVGAGPLAHTTALRSGHQTFIMRRFEQRRF
jgi:acyl-CoA synthetase (AMP-forming)/AMP-acid ligase II